VSELWANAAEVKQWQNATTQYLLSNKQLTSSKCCQHSRQL